MNNLVMDVRHVALTLVYHQVFVSSSSNSYNIKTETRLKQIENNLIAKTQISRVQLIFCMTGYM